MRRTPVALAATVLAAVLLAACGDATPAADGPGSPSSGTAPAGTASPGTGSPGSPTPSAPAGSPTLPATPTAPASPAPTATPSRRPLNGATPAPAWLNRRVLPLREDGTAAAGPTPPELDPRRIATVDELPPPPDGRFRSSVSAVPASVVGRSTWSPDCPVALEDLRYVRVTFVGFDGLPHTGELLVHRSAATVMVEAFRRLYAARFPIERMMITTVAERDAPPTGDGNTTSAFVCRSAAGSTRWSQHAYGLAVDVNPFLNPYVKGTTVLPELATSYTRRGDVRPGMLTRGSPAVRAFTSRGWVWGGDWRTLKDYMHFSRSGT